MNVVTPIDKFWSDTVPTCVKSFAWGANLSATTSKSQLQKSLQTLVKDLDEAEFDLFTAQLVIKASGMGVVGVELTKIVTWFQELRA